MGREAREFSPSKEIPDGSMLQIAGKDTRCIPPAGLRRLVCVKRKRPKTSVRSEIFTPLSRHNKVPNENDMKIRSPRPTAGLGRIGVLGATVP